MPIPVPIWKPSSTSAKAAGGLLRIALWWLCAAALAGPALAGDSITGKVTRVADADTIDVLLGSGRIRVRFHAVDAPEQNQPHAAAARAWLAEVLQNQTVTLEPVSQDQYNRMVARVFLGDRNINRELVTQGHAWAYRHYMRRADRALCNLEAAAREAKRGLWAASEPQAPWEYRASRGLGPFTRFGLSTAADCRRMIGK